MESIGPSLNAYNDIQALYNLPARPADAPVTPAEAVLVIDSGYSHTTVTPVVRGRVAQGAVRRLDVGGKLMTNYLKELTSIRHYNMMDETYVMNEAKEAVCYVAADFRADLERTWKNGGGGGPKGREVDERRRTKGSGGDDAAEVEGVDEGILVDYVLPDFNTRHHGLVRPYDPASHALKARKLALEAGVGGMGARGGGAAAPGGRGAGNEEPEEIMTLGNERFTVPELLLHPTDLGMNQAGLSETVMQSLHALPGGLWPALLANIVLTGGNARIPGLVERL